MLATCVQLYVAMFLTVPPKASAMAFPRVPNVNARTLVQSESLAAASYHGGNNGDEKLKFSNPNAIVARLPSPTEKILQAVLRPTTIGPGGPVHTIQESQATEAPIGQISTSAAQSKNDLSASTTKPQQCPTVSQEKLAQRFRRRMGRTSLSEELFCLEEGGCNGQGSASSRGMKVGAHSQGTWDYDEERFPCLVYKAKCYQSSCPSGMIIAPQVSSTWVLRRRGCTARRKREQWRWSREQIPVACVCNSAAIQDV